jgi:hypothetical protein
MILDRELWACAQQAINHHGPDVDRFIAERMTALAQAGDEAGVQAWRLIAERVDQLRRVPADDEPVH